MHALERRHLDRLVTLARPIFLILALVDLLEFEPSGAGRGAIILVAAYLAVAGVLVLLENFGPWSGYRLPLWVEVLALAAFLLLTPSVVPFWFLYLFVVFAAATNRGLRPAVALSAGIVVALLIRTAMREPAHWPNVVSWFGLAAGSFAAGAGISFLGARERQYSVEQDLLAKLTGLLQVERGLAESVRLLLDEFRRVFSAELALLAYRDDDLERIFVWKVGPGESSHIRPEAVPLERSDAYLLDDLQSSVAWNRLDGPGEGFGWGRDDGRPLRELPRLAGPSRQALQLRSLLTVVVEFSGQPVARFLLCNGRRRFRPEDLRGLERIARHLGSGLENLFLLRQIRARSIDGERGRISRDLHDGILQTLLSLEIQLDVFRQKLAHAPGQVARDLEVLQQTVRNEGAELRRMVTDMRPVRVESTDLLDLISGFAERFRNESGIALELFVDSREPCLPDHMCRELFQIYREALHNVKKHASATHVVVKLWQDEAKVSLVIDDNGQGFSFAGCFSSDELDRLRLGPISIKERARSIGGVLTVESNPGHGARLTVEIPLS